MIGVRVKREDDDDGNNDDSDFAYSVDKNDDGLTIDDRTLSLDTDER